jgi:hypothetical protein
MSRSFHNITIILDGNHLKISLLSPKRFLTHKDRVLIILLTFTLGKLRNPVNREDLVEVEVVREDRRVTLIKVLQLIHLKIP